MSAFLKTIVIITAQWSSLKSFMFLYDLNEIWLLKTKLLQRRQEKGGKINDFPHLVQISQPAICFRELRGPL